MIRRYFAGIALVLSLVLISAPAADAHICIWGEGNAIYTSAYKHYYPHYNVQARLTRIANGRSRYYYGTKGPSSYISSTYGSAANDANWLRVSNVTNSKNGPWHRANGNCLPNL